MDDMDAQNAADTDSTRPAGASPKPQDQQRQQQQPHPQLDSQPNPGSDSDGKKAKKPPVRDASPAGEIVASVPVSSSAAPPASDAPLDDRDSDAETIVLPGKDGHSPSKVRKVRQEDKSESDGDAVRAAGLPNPPRNDDARPRVVSRPEDDPPKKKRLSGSVARDRQAPRRKDISSGLSSAPTSPPQHTNHHYTASQHHRRRSDDAHSSLSDSDYSSQHRTSYKNALRDKIRSGERLLPHKRKAPKAESDDETENRHVRRQRTTSTGFDAGRPSKELKTSYKTQYNSRHRSVSPPARHHRRSASTQLPSHSSNGLSQKKKRLPPPLQTTDYHSDESSASASSHPRPTKLRSLATPATADSTVSPAKLGPHKKNVDAHGQTLLARACARGDYDGAKQRLGERPEDLNVADYAGNTPLQIAAINGREDIVKLLIDAGCNVDCVNYDKDTPLLDAVDNGHLGVVKLLLDAGVNPRKANVNGQEPIDRVSNDTENAEEIRAALRDAKKRAGERRRTSEDRYSHNDNPDARDSHAPDSPRHSPAAASAALGRRGGTIRSTKTRNDLLYTPLDDKQLRQAAGRGDDEQVVQILSVKEGYDDPESMVAAARGGHETTLQFLLGLGRGNPDPGPVSGLPSEFATPILAAIGQENIKVVALLLEQQGFDPTRRFKGETYYEIARRRQGTNWKEEEHMLKNAYDEYIQLHKDTAQTKSPSRKERERGREEKRSRREDAKDETKPSKRIASSPVRDIEHRKKTNASKLSSPKETKRSESLANHSDDHTQKRGPGRPPKDDKVPSINVSDREVSPILTHKTLKSKRTESDLAGPSSEGETTKPRKRLVSKGELRGERDKQRRASMVSNASKEPSSPRDPRPDDGSDKHKLSERYHDRTKALKRDDSRDRLSISGDGSSKRHRSSVTPDRPSNGDKDEEAPVKRRRLDVEGHERRPEKRPTSADGRPKQKLARDSSGKLSAKGNPKDNKDRDDDPRDNHRGRSQLHRTDSGKSNHIEKSIHVKSEDVDVEMQDVIPVASTEHAETPSGRDAEEELAKKRKKKRLAEEEETSRDDARKKLDTEAKNKKQREAEELQKQEEEEKRKKEMELKRKQKQQQEEAEAAAAAEDRKLKEQAERERRKAEEAARRAEEEKKRLEEEARKKEEERQKEEERRKEEEHRKEEERRREEERRKEEERRREEERVKEEERQKAEEERKRQEEKERLRQEQLEREAAEEARRQQQEEERKERERRERAHREEMEKKRAAKEAEQRRIHEEQERMRLDQLPPLLRWLDTSSNPKVPELAQKLVPILGMRADTFRPGLDNTAEGRELWALNTDIALLLGEKDLGLSRYTAWERIPVSSMAKRALWMVEWDRYALLAPKLFELGCQLGTYYGVEDPETLSYSVRQELKQETQKRFMNMEMFYVKVSDFMYTVPNIPHLHNVKLTITYRELPESEAEFPLHRQKWRQDPDAHRFHGFSPRNRYYVNGELVGEELPTPSQTSKTPFPEKRVPRRGLLQVYPDDPDYARLCIEQGLEHLVRDQMPTSLPNGLVSPTASHAEAPPTSASVNGTNGHTVHSTETEATSGKDLPNGTSTA